jgi:hypothetical protein
MRRFLVVVAALLAAFLAVPAFAAPPPLEAYGKIPAVEMVELSPDGSRYALVAVIGETRRLVVVEGDKPIASRPVGDMKVRDLDWAGEDRVFVRFSRTYNLGVYYGGRYEISHVVVLNVATGAVTGILDKSSRAGNGVWGYYGVARVDGRWYGWFGGLTMDISNKAGPVLEDGYPDLYRVDLDTGESELVDRAIGGETSTDWLVSADGELLLNERYNDRTGLWTLYRGEGRSQPVTSATLPWGGGVMGRGARPAHCSTWGVRATRAAAPGWRSR